MNKRGVSVSPNIKPGILTSHPLYEQFKKKNAFILDSEGKNVYIDNWWGGEASFIDFTNPEGREVWKYYMKEQLIKKGTTSIWNDNCQYESLDDRGAICSFDNKN